MKKSKPELPFVVYLGNNESQVYTIMATDLKDLRAKLGERWSGAYQGRWYRQPAVGYPARARRFIVKKPGGYNRPVMVMTPEGSK